MLQDTKLPSHLSTVHKTDRRSKRPRVTTGFIRIVRALPPPPLLSVLFISFHFSRRTSSLVPFSSPHVILFSFFFFLKRHPTLAQKKLYAGLLIPVCLWLHLAHRPCTWEGDVLIQLHLTFLAKTNIKKGYKGASDRFIISSTCFPLPPNTPPPVAKGQIRGTCRFCQEKRPESRLSFYK